MRIPLVIHNITEIRKAAHPWLSILNRQHGSEHFALPAYLHLFLPVLLHLTLTDRPINKPAKVANLKFPCRAILLSLRGTLSYHPTGLVLLTRGLLLGQKKEHLTFSMHRDISPTLLKALYGFKRNT